MSEPENQDPSRSSTGGKGKKTQKETPTRGCTWLEGRRWPKALSSTSLTYYNRDSTSEEARPRGPSASLGLSFNDLMFLLLRQVMKTSMPGAEDSSMIL